MTNRELLKQHIDQLDDIDIQQISQFVEFLRFCHQKNQTDIQPAQALKEDPLIGLFAGSPNLATQSEAILNQNIQTNSGWTWKPSSPSINEISECLDPITVQVLHFCREH